MKKIPLRRRYGTRLKNLDELVHYYLSPFKPEPNLEEISTKKFFCLNSGNCGSTYLIALLQSNGLSNCHHEQHPDFNLLGVNYFASKDKQRMQPRLVRMMRQTRKNTYLEASNRLFSLAPIIDQAFPDPRFIFLHRDGRETIRSIMSRPYLTYYFTRYHMASTIVAPYSYKSNYEKACHFWNEMNKTIYHDLQNHKYLNLKFSDLTKGNLLELERFLEASLDQKKLPKVNSTPYSKVDKFDEWDSGKQQIFWDICGETMENLGYHQ